jgi:hypothetical protein
MLKIQTNPAIRVESGPYTVEAINQLQRIVIRLSQIIDCDPAGRNAAPAQPTSLGITAANGLVNIQIVDRFPIDFPMEARTITYTVEAATDMGFANIVHTEYLGHARNKNIFLGNQTLFFRCLSQTFGSPPSQWTYFGGTTPQSVTCGGVAAPAQQSYQGSGTSSVGGQGFGSSAGSFNKQGGRPLI